MPFGQLNPLRTVAPPSTVTTGALANILGEQNKAFGNIGKDITEVGNVAEAFGRDVNTDALNDLIASGQLDDKGVSDIQQLIAQEAGGLRQSPEGLAMIDKLVSGAQAQELAKAKQEGAMSQLSQEQANALELLTAKTEAEREGQKLDIASKEKLKEKELAQQKLLEHEKLSSEAYQKDQEREFKKAQKKLELDEKKAQRDFDSTHKETTLSKLSQEGFTDETADKAYGDVEEFISDKLDAFWDRELDPVSRSVVRENLVNYLITPAGASAYKVGGTEALYNQVDAFLEKNNLELVDTFDWGSVWPTGKSPYQKKLKQRK